MAEKIVVIGAGQAGVQLAEGLRAGGFVGDVTLVGAEPHPPYHRPPLSKAWLAGAGTSAATVQLALRAPEALAKKAIELRTRVEVAALDRAGRRLELAGGDEIEYDRLAIATGADARRLAVPGADAQNVLALRTRDDADAIARALGACVDNRRPLAVVGGGFIGLEIAATARQRGVPVTVFEALPRLMARALAEPLSAWFAALHRRHGVRVELDARIDRIEVSADGRATAVVDAHGESHPAGLVVIGVGVEPNDALARAAGLACDRGIIVDACGRTSDPRIVAAGDCTARRLPDGSLVRLESVNNAVEQGRSAAAALLGVERPFVSAPWFWSDQFQARLQMVGLSAGADSAVVRGDPASGSFSWFHYRGDQLIAVDSVSSPKEHLAARKLLDAGRSPSPEEVADPGFDLSFRA